MKVSREQMAENRQRILQSASRLFRARGFDAVTVSEIMSAAGLTHGGFYGHFESKDDLAAQALADAFTPAPDGDRDIDTVFDRYLSVGHRDNPGFGCPTAALAGQTGHQGAAVRAAFTEGFRRQVERLSKDCPGTSEAEKRRAAIGSWAALVGATILARAVDDPAFSAEVLAQTRAWLASDT